DEARCTVEPDRLVAERTERFEIAPGAAAEVEDRERARTFEVSEQGGHVLRDVVILRTRPELLRMAIVVTERHLRRVAQVVGVTRGHVSAAAGRDTSSGVASRRTAP